MDRTTDTVDARPASAYTHSKKPSVAHHNQVLVACTLDWTVSPWRTHNHGAKQNQQRCEKESKDQRNIRWRDHHHVRQTLLQEPSRANFTYPPQLRSTYINHDDVHVGTLQTAVRTSSIIACSHTRFSIPCLRHRLHTQDGPTQGRCHSNRQESTTNIEASSWTLKPACKSN